MSNSKYHRALRRQLRRLDIDAEKGPEDEKGWRAFLAAVSQAYVHSDRDRYLLERSLNLSFVETSELHRNLNTERDRLLAVLRAMTDGLFALTLEAKVIVANEAAARMLGDSVSTLNGASVLERFQFSKLNHRELFEAIKNGEPYEEQNASLHLASRCIDISCSLTPLHEHGELVGTVFVFRDVSEQRLAKCRLAKALNEAQEAVRVKSSFLANMSHEIRTPMNGIIGMTTLLLDTSLSSTQREFAKTIGNSADALLVIINDILDISKLEADSLELEEVDIDFVQLIEEVANLLAIQAHRKRVEFVIRLSPNIPKLVTGDPGRIRQILLNLVSNAIKFTSVGEVRVSVDAMIDDGVALMECAVSDTGIGIEAESQDKLFRPFSQVDASTTRKFGGTGLGLAISHQLAVAMGGDITLSSAPGVGSCFTLQVPLKVSDLSLAGHRISCKWVVGLLEGNDSTRNILRTYLKELGCITVDISPDVIEMPNVDIDVVICDIYSICIDAEKRLEKWHSEPMLASGGWIFLTKVTTQKKVQELADRYGARVLPKPVQRSAFTKLVTEVASGKAMSGVSGTEAPVIPLPQFSGTALVVDDSSVNQRVAQGLLNRIGIKTEVADNGEDAVQKVCTKAYDVVFMDCQMPIVDGYEATRRIRQYEKEQALGQHQLIVAMTANAMSGDVARCLESGMDDYMSKPVSREQLIEMLIRRIG
ncbi:MAG: response regulator [Myxococcales bacterium]|nr:response regulator [Myxococcales bacterium]